MNSLYVQKAENIREVIRYIQKFRNSVIVIYIDEKTIESTLFSSHIKDIAFLHQAGLKVVIVPAARTRIDEVLKNNNVSWKYHNNIRITDQNSMPLIKMAAFDVSNIVMTNLAANNITAVIGNWVKARSRGIIDGVDFGTAGEIEKLNTQSILTVLNNNFIPIFPCIGWNSVGHPYNISSITLAQQIAINLNANKLFYIIDQAHINNSDYVIPQNLAQSNENTIPAMNINEVEEFLTLNSNLDNSIKSSKAKVLTVLKKAKQACQNGVDRVHIVDGSLEGVLPCEIFSELGSGTMIYTNDYGQIRAMEQCDLPSVLTIMRPFIEAGKLLPRTEEQLLSSLNDFIVFELDGGIHGCASLHIYDDNQAEIAAVAVELNFENMGIGPKMINHLLKKAKDFNLQSVFILTTQASDWFEKLGFIPDEIDTLPKQRKEIWNKKRNSKLFRLKLV